MPLWHTCEALPHPADDHTSFNPGATHPRRELTSRAADPADVPRIGSVSQAACQLHADSGADNAYVELLLKTATVRVVEEPRTGAIIAWGAVRSGPLGSMLDRPVRAPGSSRPRCGRGAAAGAVAPAHGTGAVHLQFAA